MNRFRQTFTLIFFILGLCFYSFAACPENDDQPDSKALKSGKDNGVHIEYLSPYAHSSIDNEDITPETWRRICLEIKKDDGSILEIELLRPLWWLKQAGATIGESIYYSSFEMGIDGNAIVVGINECDIDSRKYPNSYNVVTGKFIHRCVDVLDLYFDNSSTEPIGVTKTHPFWSVTRDGWVRAGELEVGESVKTQDGISRLVKLAQRPGKYTVYNLEVHKTHNYYVSGKKILVHNNGCMGRIPRFNGPKPKYTINPAHVGGKPGFNPKKTTLPSDAEEVFKHAVPGDPENPRAWFSMNSNGDIYRYSVSNGEAHFSGSSVVGDGIRNLTTYAKHRLGIK